MAFRIRDSPHCWRSYQVLDPWMSVSIILISDRTSLVGLRRIAACPSLKKLMLKEPEEGSLEYRKIVASIRSEFPRIKITGIE